MSIGQRILAIFRSRSARSSDVDDLKNELDASYRSQLQLLQNVRRGVADVSTSRKRVELQISKLTQQGVELTKTARTAVAAGDDDSARRALTRKVAIDEAAADLEEQRAQIKADEDRLTDSATDIQNRIESFRIRIDTLSARHTAAAARTKINSAVTGISGQMGEVGAAMRETEQRTRRLEAKADAVDELVAEGVIDDATAGGNAQDARFDREFEALSASTTTVDDQLEQLKRHTISDSGGGHDGKDPV